MTRRTLMTAIVVMTIAASLSAQSGKGSAFRTPWGDPDLQGVWDYWTFTPLERPRELADKATYTDAEHAALLQKLAGRAAALDAATLPQGTPGGYSQELWTDRARGTALKQTSLIVYPEDGRIPPLTPEAQKKAEAHKAAGGRPVRMRTDGIGSDNPEDRGLSERCLVGFSTGPPFQPGGYNNNVQIVQTKDYVMLLLEMNHDVRIIPMDGRPRLPKHIVTWLGDARGRWEGNTLVVESTNFTPKVAAFSARVGATGFELGSAENLTLIEKFRRVDAKTLEYEFTIDDPTTFTKPFTGRLPMRATDELMYEYACHEGNYGMENIMRGARVEDGTSNPAGRVDGKR